MVTTEEPVLSTALVMKDLFEYILTSLNIDLVNGWDIKFDGDMILIEIADAINNCLFLLFINFVFIFFQYIGDT